jgi:hypothetical protein
VVLLGYALLAVVLTWPLSTHLRTDLPGDPSGDTGVYVWNLWIFRHELLAHAHLPFSTQHIFALSGGADFSLHNYTAIANVVAVPLIGVLGVAASFNVILMLALALSGAATWLLARRLGMRSFSAWVAGALFTATPLISARASAHLSLVITGGLPLFLWMLLRTVDRPTMARGVGVGATVALATYSDVYFGVYCILMGAFLLSWRFLQLEQSRRSGRPVRVARILGIAAVAVAATALLGVASGVERLQVGGLIIRGVDEPYGPAMIVVVLAIGRQLALRRFRVRLLDAAQVKALVPPGAAAVAACLVLLAPPIVGVGLKYLDNRLPNTQILWRSSPRGVDLLAYVVPNPEHAVIGRWTRRWLLPPVEDAFPELVASCSLLAIAAVIVAGLRRRLPPLWTTFTLCFAALSLGPFLFVGGVNTYVPGPWAVLRYVPVVGMARSPSRFAIVAALGLSLLFGFVVEQWLANATRRRQAAWVAAFLVLIALEVIPAPRMLFSAKVPDIYGFVAGDADERNRLLELPSGIRDGTSSLGDFSARTAYFQTGHGHPLLGGYLSRVSEWRKEDAQTRPVLRALYALSEPEGAISEQMAQAARDRADRFLARSCVRYVMVDTTRASTTLRQFAADTLHLKRVHADGQYELLVPVSPPACESEE